MGPGPSDVDPRVLEAMSRPTLGHLDPAFLTIMDQVADMLRTVFGTANRLTLPMSGTGSAGMETVFANLLEPGDRALVGVNGVFGTRMAEVARRCGAEVVTVERPWGEAFTPDDFRQAAAASSFRLMALVHAETSTGVLQSFAGMRAVADQIGALLVADTVTSVGGVPVALDAWGIDAAYSGTQKCLSCPPGLAPVSLGPRAWQRLEQRRRPVQSWYLDLGLIASYWGGNRAYHHTAPIHMIYALHEALRLTLEEGLEARWQRHQEQGAALVAGLESLGLELVVAPPLRMPQLTVVRVPVGLDDRRTRAHLLENHGIEIGAGLGPMAGKSWRIGLMGATATPAKVERCLQALGEAMNSASCAADHG